MKGCSGYIGRDNHGQVEGTFFRPPAIEIAGPEDDLMEWDRPPDFHPEEQLAHLIHVPLHGFLR